MNEEVAKLIRDELLSQNNKPINYDFDLVDHLKTYTDKELSRNIYTNINMSIIVVILYFVILLVSTYIIFGTKDIKNM